MTTTTALPLEEAVTKRLFTADEVIHLAESGFFADDERLELIEGEIVRMTPIGARHNKTVTLLNAILAALVVEKRVVVSIQGAISLDPLNLPQPDVAVVNMNYLEGTSHPKPDQIHLLIEVSDATLRIDRGKKLPLYARAGIAEYWIVNLQDNVLEVHREPDPATSCYRRRQVVSKDQSIAPLAFPDFSIAVGDVLP